MKQTLILLLAAALLLFALPAAAQPQAALEGEILEITADGQFLLLTESYGQVLVQYGEQTALEGLAIPRAGMWVTVTYNGAMTRSLPPQITADRISRFVLDGVVMSVDADTATLLLETPAQGQVLARFETLPEGVAAGDFLTVSYNGVMTFSYPGQIQALSAVRHESTQGVVTDVQESFIILNEGDAAVRVNIDGNTRLYGQILPGEQVTIYHSGVAALSMPPQIFGEAVVGAMPETP